MKFTIKQIKQIIKEELALVGEIDQAEIEPPVATAEVEPEEDPIQPLSPEQDDELRNMADAIKLMAAGDKKQIEVILAQLSTDALG